MTLKCFPIANGQIINRGICTFNDETSIQKALARAPKATSVEVRDGVTVVAVYDIVNGEVKAREVAAPSAKRRGRPPGSKNGDAAPKAPAAPKNPDHGVATKIVYDFMASGRAFTRVDLYDALRARFPERTEVSIWDIIGTTMHTLRVKHGFEVVKTKTEGSRRKTFQFKLPAAQAVPVAEQEQMAA